MHGGAFAKRIVGLLHSLDAVPEQDKEAKVKLEIGTLDLV